MTQSHTEIESHSQKQESVTIQGTECFGTAAEFKPDTGESDPGTALYLLRESFSMDSIIH